ncbi:MAG: acetate kinase [Bacilli bacterium]|nr:acetate kinase [Bacilli bacterium]
MKILSVNAGSSSLKFQLFEMPEEKVIASGKIERIGLPASIITVKTNGEKRCKEKNVHDHAEAVQELLALLLDLKIVASLDEIKGVGHRVVHGGEKFSDSVLITDEVIAEIDKLSELAPLHNPANLIGIQAFKQVLPNAKQVAVFDTAFHQTMPIESYLYPTPYSWYEKYGIRRYGFHGTSHKYVSERAYKLLGKGPEGTKLITIHLGNGASVTAIKDGKSIETSMGFTPLAGLMMGTRSGDVDPSILPFAMQKENCTFEEALNALNYESGLKGISLISSDMRDILKGVNEGNRQCILAFNLYVKRVCDYIGQYYILLGGCDALVFTAGIGENSGQTRQAIIDRLGVLEIRLDAEANQVMGQECVVSTSDSKIKVLVIPTNEELVIARDTLRLIS